MTDDSDEFDPESAEEREIGREAADDSSDFFSLMGHVYRGELGRAASWRTLLSEDLREPTIKAPATEAVARRLKRVYFPLLGVLGGAWLIRLTVFAPTSTGIVETAAVGGVPGVIVLTVVGLIYGCLCLLTFWPWQRHAKGELKSQRRADEWK